MKLSECGRQLPIHLWETLQNSIIEDNNIIFVWLGLLLRCLGTLQMEGLGCL